MIRPQPLQFHDNTGVHEYGALSPHISSDTLRTHYEKHYKGYIKNLGKLIKGTVHEDSDLIEIVTSSAGPIFNNAAQAYNHEFYFNCLTPTATTPSSELLEAIEEVAGSLAAFKSDFNKVSKQLFGSGWTWLVWDTYDESLDVLVLKNAGTPITESKIRPDQDYIPLMCCDLWEHARYLDYKNNTGDYLDAFWEVVNWEFVNKQFKDIKK